MSGNLESGALATYDRSLHLAGGAVACLIVAGMSGMIWGVILPQQRSTVDRLDAAAAFVELAPAIQRRHEELTQQQQAIELRRQTIMQRVPEAPHEAAFLAELSELAVRTRLSVEEYRPGVTAKSANFHQVDVGLSAAGEYDAICRFLAGLETLSRYNRIVSLAISTSGEDSPWYNVDLQLRIFHQAVKSPAIQMVQGVDATGGQAE